MHHVLCFRLYIPGRGEELRGAPSCRTVCCALLIDVAWRVVVAQTCLKVLLWDSGCEGAMAAVWRTPLRSAHLCCSRATWHPMLCSPLTAAHAPATCRPREDAAPGCAWRHPGPPRPAAAHGRHWPGKGHKDPRLTAPCGACWPMMAPAAPWSLSSTCQAGCNCNCCPLAAAGHEPLLSLCSTLLPAAQHPAHRHCGGQPVPLPPDCDRRQQAVVRGGPRLCCRRCCCCLVLQCCTVPPDLCQLSGSSSTCCWAPVHPFLSTSPAGGG